MSNLLNIESGPLSFVRSRKAWVSMAVILAFAVMFYYDKIDAERFTEVLKYVFTVWVGAMAAEKGAKAIGNKTTVVNTTEEKQ